MSEEADTRPEPWLRNTLLDVEPIRRAILHALQLASEDVERWAAPLSDTQIVARPAGLPSVAFQLRHIVRSLDRLLTYAADRQLNDGQLTALHTEMAEARSVDVLAEFRYGLAYAMERVRAVAPETFADPRSVGRKRLPTTVAGLLIHCAEHTQRHVGQMITTAKFVKDQPCIDR